MEGGTGRVVCAKIECAGKRNKKEIGSILMIFCTGMDTSGKTVLRANSSTEVKLYN